jgi:hypothetical protein
MAALNATVEVTIDYDYASACLTQIRMIADAEQCRRGLTSQDRLAEIYRIAQNALAQAKVS